MAYFNNSPPKFIDGYKPPPTLADLPSAAWSVILQYLAPQDMRNLILLNKRIKTEVEPHLYQQLTLTEWASSGARLVRAILKGTVSDETCACIRKLHILFTSFDEISETLEILSMIAHRLQNLSEILIEAHKTEDCYCAIEILRNKFLKPTISIKARAPSSSQDTLARSALPLVYSAQLPRLFQHEFAYLENIKELMVDEVISDTSNTLLRTNGVIQHLALPYSAYTMLGSPPSVHLELALLNGDAQVVIRDPACTLLKLVAHSDLPHIDPYLKTPSLKVLILCNLAPLPSMKLADQNNLTTIEFISIAPVTIPALQALASKPFLPNLKLVLAMVTRSSFLSTTPSHRRREARKLVEWLQVLASTYPVDVRDFSRLLSEDIYFSDGLWCLAAQTRFKKYLHLVAPPPLKS